MKEQYDKLYSRQSNAWRKRRLPFYRKLASFILPTDNVLDLGCGNGILASLSNWNKYLGIDYSQVAIEQARRFCPKAEFICADIFEYIRVTNYSTVVITEVLEHIIEDIKIIWKLRSGSKVIISVPNDEPVDDNGKPINCRFHVRNYTTESIAKRFSMIDFTEIFVFETWIIAVGIKR
jgi:2-polyprenyl-3-methyl-5-hydroxy-6-metoxy-1,4-benzoquinol methylase